MNYITNGQGLGIRFLLLLSVAVAIVVSVYTKIIGSAGVPYAQQVAEQVLPIKVEDGTVVQPENTIKNINVFNDLDLDTNDNFSVVVNTTVDSLNINDLDYGVYLTRKALYIVSPNETKVQKLEGNFYVPMDDYTSLFNKFVNWMLIIVFPFALTFSFIIYFLLTIFYSTCAIAICALMNKKFDFDFRMRMSTVAFITTYIVFIPLSWIGVSSRLLFFFAVLGLQALIIKDAETPKIEKRRSKNKI